MAINGERISKSSSQINIEIFSCRIKRLHRLSQASIEMTSLLSAAWAVKISDASSCRREDPMLNQYVYAMKASMKYLYVSCLSSAGDVFTK